MRRDSKNKTLKNFTVDRWSALMDSFRFNPSLQIFEALDKAYGEKHRAYHSREHIEACLRHLDTVRDQANNPDEIELALWFHDAVYKPFSATNEEESADWLADFLSSQNAEPQQSNRIFDMIILTKEHALPESNDEKLMLDIDLSILGTPSEIYDQFEKDVRREYKWVPGFIFKKKRKEILKGFLERKAIYQTPYFFEALVSQAKRNLQRAIEKLA